MAGPGSNIQEPGNPVPIEGVDVSTAALLGAAARGPLEPVLLAGWEEYQRLYGGPVDSYLPDAAAGFFTNGGQRLYVVRVAGQGAAAAAVNLGGLRVEATGPGAWGRRVYARLSGASGAVRLVVRYYAQAPGWLGVLRGRARPAMEERYENLVLERGAPGNIEEVVNRASRLVRVTLLQDGPRRPGGMAWFRTLRGGADGAPPAVVDYQPGLDALAALGLPLLVAAPDAVRPERIGINERLVELCERSGALFAILAAPNIPPDPAAVSLPPATRSAALYLPWIVVSPDGAAARAVPPVGHVAGAIARSDREQGVHTAPANLELAGVNDVAYPIGADVQDALTARGVNTIRDFRAQGRGIRVWGGRTLSADPEWKYVSVRRYMIFLERSISGGLQFAVFEPNGEDLWSLVTRLVSDFLFQQWHNGALQGARPEEAFFVRCNRSTMTQDDLDNGRLVVELGVAVVRPAEFVIIRISSLTASAHDDD